MESTRNLGRYAAPYQEDSKKYFNSHSREITMTVRSIIQEGPIDSTSKEEMKQKIREKIITKLPQVTPYEDVINDMVLNVVLQIQ